MSELLLFVVYLCLGFIIISVVSIIKIKRMKIYTNHTLEPHDLKSVQGLDANIFEVLSEKFYRYGFELIGDYKHLDINTKQISYSREFVHKNLATLAGISYHPNGFGKTNYQRKNDDIFQKYNFLINTRFTDETCFASTSIDRPKVFKYDGRVMSANQEIKDLDNVINNHVIKVNELITTKALDYSLITTERQKLMNESFVKGMDKQVKHGILKYDSANKCYQYTWDAAIKSYIRKLRFF